MAATKAKELEESEVLLDTSKTGVAVVTLNRPPVRNALDLTTLVLLRQMVLACEQDDDIRVIILTGAGSCFCSGDDLRAARNGGVEQFAETIEALQLLTTALLASPKPIIAALNGPAFGAGLELVLGCDVRLATNAFVCGVPEVRLGLVATNGASLLLPLLVGQSRARRMMLAGAPHDAHWCLEAGLIDEVSHPDQLMPRAYEVASDLMQGSPGAVASTRKLLHGPLAGIMDQALRLEAELCNSAYASGECREGLDAHFEKRLPNWIPE